VDQTGQDHDRGHEPDHGHEPDRGQEHAHEHGHTHDHDAGHAHDGGHGHDGRSRAWPLRVFRPHRHDHADSLDDAVLADRAGGRALAISLAGLLATAIVQAVIVGISGSVGLLADAIHNFADALTAIPIGLAFFVARRPPTRRYTYGYGRAEDLAGLAVVAVMTASAGVAAWQAIDRLAHPQAVHHLAWVAVAGVVGFAGNELAARYRIRVGTRIGSAALVADGHHARTDGFTSLAVVAGAGGVALGWPAADPVVGLVITVAILAVLRGAIRDIYRRLMDAIDPALVGQIEQEVCSVPGITRCDAVRVRWIGHELHAELDLTIDRDLRVSQAHELTETVRHQLLHQVRRLTDATIHVNPDGGDGGDAHALTAHHYATRQARLTRRARRQAPLGLRR
jgi:cation diffusion facilitator family transporter